MSLGFRCSVGIYFFPESVGIYSETRTYIWYEWSMEYKIESDAGEPKAILIYFIWNPKNELSMSWLSVSLAP
jgi:hypothetical protein